MRPRPLNRALVVAACALVTTTLAACESTQRESTQIELRSRAAQAAEAAKERAAKQRAAARASRPRPRSKTAPRRAAAKA
jgi:ABC-type uncharacterized transport system auxiliary subunit